MTSSTEPYKPPRGVNRVVKSHYCPVLYRDTPDELPVEHGGRIELRAEYGDKLISCCHCGWHLELEWPDIETLDDVAAAMTRDAQ